METARENYRKLPGRRRGIFFGSSVWLGSDHLLLVKSARFREDYKRFYFRDIQAIVAAQAPRFHISTRSALIGYGWLAALFLAIISRAGRGILQWLVAAIGLLLIAAWAYLCTRRSCRCRIYTAVSADELPSLYRTWNMRRFLQQVLPYITQAQGAMESGWAEEIDDCQVGPKPEGRTASPTAGSAPLQVRPGAPAGWTPISVCFVGSLCLGGLAELMSIRAGAEWGRWTVLAAILFQFAAAVAVLIQNFKGKLRSGMRNLAIVTLISLGSWYYATQFTVAIAAAYQNTRAKQATLFPPQAQGLALFEYPMVRASAGGISLLLALAGLILGLRGQGPREERVRLNV